MSFENTHLLILDLLKSSKCRVINRPGSQENWRGHQNLYAYDIQPALSYYTFCAGAMMFLQPVAKGLAAGTSHWA